MAAEEIIVDQSENGRHFSTPVEDLVDSIRAVGQQSPCKVRMAGDKLKLVFGFRRVEAIRQLNAQGGPPRPVVVEIIDCNDEEAFTLNVRENNDRRDLSHMDAALNCRRLIEHYGKTAAEVAAIMRKSPAWVTQHLKLCRLPAELQRAIHEGQIPPSAGFELADADDSVRQSVLSALETPAVNAPTAPAAPAESAARAKPRLSTVTVRAAHRNTGVSRARSLREIKETVQTLSATGAPRVSSVCRAFLRFLQGTATDEQFLTELRAAVAADAA